MQGWRLGSNKALEATKGSGISAGAHELPMPGSDVDSGSNFMAMNGATQQSEAERETDSIIGLNDLMALRERPHQLKLQYSLK